MMALGGVDGLRVSRIDWMKSEKEGGMWAAVKSYGSDPMGKPQRTMLEGKRSGLTDSQCAAIGLMNIRCWNQRPKIVP